MVSSKPREEVDKQREKYNVSNTAYRPITKTVEKLTLKSESESRSALSNSLQPHGILQARILEWVVAITFSMEFSRPEYWNG